MGSASLEWVSAAATTVTPSGLDPAAARVLRRLRLTVRWGTWALGMVLIACVMAGWSSVTSRRSFDRRAIQTTAVVERVCGCTGAVVRFPSADGQVVETKVGLNGTGGVVAGGALLVAYDPADPTRVQAPGHRGRPYSGAVFAALYALLWGVPLLTVGRRVRDRTAAAADLLAVPWAVGTPMRIVTWTRPGRPARTAASLYPDLAEPPPAGTVPIGVVNLLPTSAARRIPEWSRVEVLGPVAAGGTVAICHDGRTYLASGPVRSGNWETSRRWRRPADTVGGRAWPLPTVGTDRVGVVTATRRLVGRVAARDPKTARRLTAAVVAMIAPVPLFVLSALTLAVFGQPHLIPTVALPLGGLAAAGGLALQVLVRRAAAVEAGDEDGPSAAPPR